MLTVALAGKHAEPSSSSAGSLFSKIRSSSGLGNPPVSSVLSSGTIATPPADAEGARDVTGVGAPLLGIGETGEAVGVDMPTAAPPGAVSAIGEAAALGAIEVTGVGTVAGEATGATVDAAGDVTGVGEAGGADDGGVGCGAPGLTGVVVEGDPSSGTTVMVTSSFAFDDKSARRQILLLGATMRTARIEGGMSTMSL